MEKGVQLYEPIECPCGKHTFKKYKVTCPECGRYVDPCGTIIVPDRVMGGFSPSSIISVTCKCGKFIHKEAGICPHCGMIADGKGIVHTPPPRPHIEKVAGLSMKAIIEAEEQRNKKNIPGHVYSLISALHNYSIWQIGVRVDRQGQALIIEVPCGESATKKKLSDTTLKITWKGIGCMLDGGFHIKAENLAYFLIEFLGMFDLYTRNLKDMAPHQLSLVVAKMWARYLCQRNLMNVFDNDDIDRMEWVYEGTMPPKPMPALKGEYWSELLGKDSDYIQYLNI